MRRPPTSLRFNSTAPTSSFPRRRPPLRSGPISPCAVSAWRWERALAALGGRSRARRAASEGPSPPLPTSGELCEGSAVCMFVRGSIRRSVLPRARAASAHLPFTPPFLAPFSALHHSALLCPLLAPALPCSRRRAALRVPGHGAARPLRLPRGGLLLRRGRALNAVTLLCLPICRRAAAGELCRVRAGGHVLRRYRRLRLLARQRVRGGGHTDGECDGRADLLLVDTRCPIGGRAARCGRIASSSRRGRRARRSLAKSPHKKSMRHSARASAGVLAPENLEKQYVREITAVQTE